MTAHTFVDSVRTEVCDASVSATLSTLLTPPGRRPDPAVLESSNWYISLPEGDRKRVADVVRFACEMATFTFLAVIDGAKVIEDGPEKGEIELLYRRGDLIVRLNDPDGEELHDLFNTV